ncbi:dienelactone hydrolase family protein [Rhizobium sp. PP-F2F-G48]|uniref:dienelactone hydrolase family protein n=1 Tax=Rhizobium sp. PP-F2F-G48 TaxID=2135651 RepID=UPI001049701B|nr:dienelactone hydrolase family protein [Rhizobium sp. PP-F2F-G48]TCM53273.1 dienelactone hydrolase family protein [Rhizobium sp. PP-F2F-G48]
MIDDENMPDLARRLRDRNSFAWNFDPDVSDVATWQMETRDAVRRALDIGTTATPSASVLAEWDDGGLSGQHLRIGFSNGETADAYWLRPQTRGPAPGILLLHDHGSSFSIGRQKLIRRPDEEHDAAVQSADWARRFYGGRHLGNALAHRGYSVLCVDALGWGGRAGTGYEGQQALAANLMQFGQSLAGVVLREDLEALELLRHLDGIDPERVASFGFSMGGARAWQLAALSSGAKACVAAGWMGTLSGLMQSGSNQLRGQSAFYLLHPAIAGRIDYPHLAALAAPKPALFLSGRDDRHFPETVATDAFRQMRGIWDATRASDALRTRMVPGGHVFEVQPQEDAIDWLDRVL